MVTPGADELLQVAPDTAVTTEDEVKPKPAMVRGCAVLAGKVLVGLRLVAPAS